MRDTFGLVRWWIDTWDYSYILVEATDCYCGVWDYIEVTDEKLVEQGNDTSHSA